MKPAARAMASSNIAVARPREVRRNVGGASRDHRGRMAMLAGKILHVFGSPELGSSPSDRGAS